MNKLDVIKGPKRSKGESAPHKGPRMLRGEEGGGWRAESGRVEGMRDSEELLKALSEARDRDSAASLRNPWI